MAKGRKRVGKSHLKKVGRKRGHKGGFKKSAIKA